MQIRHRSWMCTMVWLAAWFASYMFSQVGVSNSGSHCILLPKDSMQILDHLGLQSFATYTDYLHGTMLTQCGNMPGQIDLHMLPVIILPAGCKDRILNGETIVKC